MPERVDLLGNQVLANPQFLDIVDIEQHLNILLRVLLLRQIYQLLSAVHLYPLPIQSIQLLDKGIVLGKLERSQIPQHREVKLRVEGRIELRLAVAEHAILKIIDLEHASLDEIS